jgi:hypothetical protein
MYGLPSFSANSGNIYIHYDNNVEVLMSDQKLKKDAGKNRVDLIPASWILDDGKVLTFGIEKGYQENSWKKVDPKRYKAAVMRHLLAYLNGETHDPESGLHHLAHVRVNAGFLMSLEQQLYKHLEEIWEEQV